MAVKTFEEVIRELKSTCKRLKSNYMMYVSTPSFNIVFFDFLSDTKLHILILYAPYFTIQIHHSFDADRY